MLQLATAVIAGVSSLLAAYVAARVREVHQLVNSQHVELVAKVAHLEGRLAEARQSPAEM